MAPRAVLTSGALLEVLQEFRINESTSTFVEWAVDSHNVALVAGNEPKYKKTTPVGMY